jgi:cyclic pyranopterin phosphate synthase
MIHPTRRRPTPAPSGERLEDPFGRRLDYLRLSVTDRCNLRCRYCMPASGVAKVGHDDVLRIEEMLELCSILVDLGVRKIRLTGGEPLVRRGVLDLLRGLDELPTPPTLAVTTNGVLIEDKLDALLAAGVDRVNLSLDSLRPETFARITRRDDFDRVRRGLDLLLAAPLDLKINVVVLPGTNDHEFGDFVDLVRDHDVTVRFIEPMPFDGDGGREATSMDGDAIVDRLRTHVDLRPLGRGPRDVAETWESDALRGRLGVIRAHTRAFCADCNRLRLDARGRLRTCLYGTPSADLGAILRSGGHPDTVRGAIAEAITRRHADGYVAEATRARTTTNESMSSIGG